MAFTYPLVALTVALTLLSVKCQLSKSRLIEIYYGLLLVIGRFPSHLLDLLPSLLINVIGFFSLNLHVYFLWLGMTPCAEPPVIISQPVISTTASRARRGGINRG